MKADLQRDRRTPRAEEYACGQAVVAALAAFFAVAGLVAFAAFAAVFLCSDVCAPYFLLNRSTRPSVSISFWRPVKNGWQAERFRDGAQAWSSGF